MENEKNKGTVNNGAINKEAAVDVKAQDFEMDYTDPFAVQRQKESESTVAEHDSNSTVFDVPVPLTRYVTLGKDGVSYANYRVAWKISVKGVKVEYVLELIPTDNRKMLYEILESMYIKKVDEKGTPVEYFDRLNLQVVKTVTVSRRDGSKSTSYSFQLSTTDDSGFTSEIPLRPKDAASRVAFNYLIDKLKKSGTVT